LRYANTLRSVGHFEAAEAEYTRLIEKNPSLLEAWYNLAAIHIITKRKREAKKDLQHLVAQAGKTGELSRSESNWAYNAQLYLDGSLSLDNLTPENLFGAAKLNAPKTKRPAK